MPDDPKTPQQPKKVDRRITPLSDAELDREAIITPDDIAHARKAWQEDAPREARELLNAEEETDDGE